MKSSKHHYKLSNTENRLSKSGLNKTGVNTDITYIGVLHVNNVFQ